MIKIIDCQYFSKNRYTISSLIEKLNSYNNKNIFTKNLVFSSKYYNQKETIIDRIDSFSFKNGVIYADGIIDVQVVAGYSVLRVQNKYRFEEKLKKFTLLKLFLMRG